MGIGDICPRFFKSVTFKFHRRCMLKLGKPHLQSSGRWISQNKQTQRFHSKLIFPEDQWPKLANSLVSCPSKPTNASKLRLGQIFYSVSPSFNKRYLPNVGLVW